MSDDSRYAGRPNRSHSVVTCLIVREASPRPRESEAVPKRERYQWGLVGRLALMPCSASGSETPHQSLRNSGRQRAVHSHPYHSRSAVVEHCCWCRRPQPTGAPRSRRTRSAGVGPARSSVEKKVLWTTCRREAPPQRSPDGDTLESSTPCRWSTLAASSKAQSKGMSRHERRALATCNVARGLTRYSQMRYSRTTIRTTKFCMRVSGRSRDMGVLTVDESGRR
jgi:hypothetical protein